MQTDNDRFGYYCVGNHKFYSKFDAAEFAFRTDQKVTWNYNDTIFGMYDWKREPQDSLPELYRKRAQQLRDQYDYLVLWYSGGADCDNILDTFVDNNIVLDEAVGCVNFEATKNTHGWVNSEIYHLSVPKIQHVKETKQPWLRHTLLDMCEPGMNYFGNPANKFDWIYKANEYLNPSYFSRVQAIKQNRHWNDLINQGKRIGFIWGIDKPRVTGLNGHFYFAFKDMLDSTSASHQLFEKVDGYATEMFYWTPDMPEVVIKQCHVLKNLLKNISLPSELLSEQRIDTRLCDSAVTKQGRVLWLNWKTTCVMLYPKWYDRPYTNKPASLIFTPRDQWFFDLPDNEVAKQVWKQGLEHRWNKTPDTMKVDPKNMSAGFKFFNSKHYYLGT